jgi:PAS domain-containing protein
VVHVEKTRIKGKIYYKLVHSIRVNGKVKSKTKYLGKDLPGEEQLEKLKKDFYREVIEKRSLEKQSIPVAAPNVNLKEKKDYLFEKSPIAIIEMDWSELKIHLDNLNVANLEDYLAERPQRIQALLNEIQVKKANDCALNLFGVVSNKFFKNFSDFVPAHSLTSFIQIFSKIFQGAVKISHDIVIKNSRDNEIDLKMDVSILKTDWSSVSIVFQDISELKLNLEKSDIAFKALNSSNNAIIISDRVGIITYANKSFIEMFNYSSKYSRTR